MSKTPDQSAESARVLITGAAGNLGRKLAEYLAPRCALTLLDRVAAPGVIAADLSVWNDEWTRHFEGIDAVVHLAGNPVAYHDWPELIGPNIDAVANVFEAAARNGVRRVIFASSNHVMGGYQDEPGVPITEALPPRPGLRYFADGAERFSGAYAATKIFGERLGQHYATARGLEVIAIRIGWVWRGVNEPSELPVERGDWFRLMWLSDRDYLQLMDRALATTLPCERFLIVNGMSNNTGSRWSQSLARTALGYHAQDDVTQKGFSIP
jgi:NAD+ dependent glucose-6-phosphate dehydrogenase